MDIKIEITAPEAGYELIDSGDSEKLERYGDVITSRPDPQALWPKNHPELWSKAQAKFIRTSEHAKWELQSGVAEEWQISISGLKFWIKPSAFKHTGVFPEQVSNWKWTQELIKKSGVKPKVLNLFGYTGGATLAAAQAGAEVVHVDGSKSAVTWARENAEISGLKDAPIRWILDDVRDFVRREIKRENKYDGIIMDPPAFGHGADKQVWKIEEDFLKLLEDCKKILSQDPLFFLINGYASGYSSLTYSNNLKEIMKERTGMLEMGELTIQESGSGRLLPAGIFARWSKTL